MSDTDAILIGITAGLGFCVLVVLIIGIRVWRKL